MNAAAAILKDMREAQEQVSALCGFTSEEIGDMQFASAFECLERVLGSDQYGIDQLPKTSAFWHWWKEQWFRRDEQFLNNIKFDIETGKHIALIKNEGYLYVESASQFRQVYREYHRIDANNPEVNNNLMETSFHFMIKELAKNK
jgi:hypothetical protein